MAMVMIPFLLIDHSKLTVKDNYVFVAHEDNALNLVAAIKKRYQNSKYSLADVDERKFNLWRCRKEGFPNLSPDERKKCLESLKLSDDSNDVAKIELMANVGHLKLDADEFVIVEVNSGFGEEEYRAELRNYEDIIIHAGEKGRFSFSDIQRNKIKIWDRTEGELPKFVKRVHDKLQEKRTLFIRNPANLREELKLEKDSDFGTDYDVNSEFTDRPPGHFVELLHVLDAKLCDWCKNWDKMMETAVNSGIFSSPVKHLFLQEGTEDIQCQFGSLSWLWSMMIKVMGDESGPNHYTPKSDLAVWKILIPLILVEIASKGSGTNQGLAGDHIRLILQSACAVRVADHELESKGSPREFVLLAIYIDDKLTAHRYLFFEYSSPEESGSKWIYYTYKTYKLQDQLVENEDGTQVVQEQSKRSELIRQLYNAAEWVKEEQGIRLSDKLIEVQTYCKDRVSSFFSPGKATKRGSDTGKGKGSSLGPSQTQGQAQDQDSSFQSSKYVVWTKERLPAQPKRIYRVQRIGDASRTPYIAKKPREGRDELEILQAIDALEDRCENIIPLVETIETSVGLCMVFPEYWEVAAPLYLKSGRGLIGHCVDLTRQLARGLSFLHEHNIAHLDIKPANLVFTSDYRLMIIDFDTATFVEGEDDWMRGHFGCEGYMAPEMEAGETFSPIRADRFSCGRVFEAFIKVAKEVEDVDALRQFAEKLVSDDPLQRPSLREWCEPPSQVENAEGDAEGSEGETLVESSEMEVMEAKDAYRERPIKRSRLFPSDPNLADAANIVC